LIIILIRRIIITIIIMIVIIMIIIITKIIKIQLNLVMSKWLGPGKYFDIGMFLDNKLGIIGSQNVSFKKNAFRQASFYHLI